MQVKWKLFVVLTAIKKYFHKIQWQPFSSEDSVLLTQQFHDKLIQVRLCWASKSTINLCFWLIAGLSDSTDLWGNTELVGEPKTEKALIVYYICVALSNLFNLP